MSEIRGGTSKRVRRERRRCGGSRGRLEDAHMAWPHGTQRRGEGGGRGRGRACTDQLIAGQGAGPDGRTDPIHVLRCDAGRARARPSSAFHAPWVQVYHHHTRTPSATLLLRAMRARSWVGAVRKKIARRKIITTVLSSTYYYSSNFLERCR